MSPKSSKPTTDASGTVKLKAVTPPTQSAKPAAQPAGKTPTIVSGATPVVAKTVIKKPEFLERAVARTDVKKRDAKPAIEAALAELAELLADGNDLNLPPLGKFKVVKSKDIGDGAQVLTLKLRTMKDSAGGSEMPGVTPVFED
ncbi:DNA-binding protein [Cognatiyoonia koreensis]|uniref:DNA-binding protein n=1 Tax=Cognatiyoonia koreensis TaxID=364200 RepID=A0A1I0PQ36_9RHOB|nr:HU family DNA-binding protein [Cognatiyoonia koreensis]SEW16413.1 DNA-binding protein [Cognatiyoonia koreensis]